MKDYRPWWAKGWEVGDFLHSDVDDVFYDEEEFDFLEIKTQHFDDNNFNCFLEQMWAIQVGLA